MKKIIISIIAVVLIIGVGAFGYFSLQNNNSLKDNSTEKEENTNTDDVETDDSSTNEANGKILVVYYSAQNHTANVAKKIAENLGADTFEIVPKKVYSEDDLNWTNSNSRVSKEHDNKSLRNVELKNITVNNWDSYDTILIGYPIWWGVAAWPVNTFVKANNFDGKTVIPFCTSASSGLGQSGELLEEDANGGTWKAGQRFSSSPSDKDIKTFTDKISS